MLNGIDISHHNQNMKDLKDILGRDFVIMKASEGMGFRDSAVSRYMSVIGSKVTPLVGFYHFARPEINSNPIVEAKNFLGVIEKYLMYHPVLALDVEARALTVPFLDQWCADFCAYILKYTGILPVIYCSSAETKRFKKCCEMGCGLWVAKWGKKPTKKDIAPWEFWAIWQNDNSQLFSGIRVDTDIFNGDIYQFLKYGGVTDGEEDDTVTDYTTD